MGWKTPDASQRSFEQRENEVSDCAEVLDQEASDKRYKRYKNIQYRNLAVKSFLAFFFGVLVAYIFKL